MKVFEVVMEYCKSDSTEIRTTRQYVTSEKDTIISVTEHYSLHCFEYDKDLKSVKEILVIVEHVN